MAVTVANLIQGPAVLYTGVVGTTEPATNSATPAVGWVDVGGTDGGVKLVLHQDYNALEVDQIAIAVGERLVGQAITVETNLAEGTLANLRVALNQAVSAATFLELDSAVGTAEPYYQGVLIKGTGPSGAGRMIIVRRCLSTDDVSAAYTKDKQTFIPVKFSAHYVSASIKAVRVDDTP